ncbi:uncharacterized protein LOC134837117 [Culicoides brevitarsis]|uniref:uncharacterized protein LOC134837117 n=1 Tax=Culicoides brevitarsis TaxID=469753 RepID=UPI00307BA8E3
MSAESSQINNSRHKSKNYGSITVENRIFQSENPHDGNIPENNTNKFNSNLNNARKIVIKFVERQVQELQRRNFRISRLRSHLKLLRKILHLNKNPKKKGYDKYLNEEEKRWLENYYMNNPQTHFEPRWIAGTVSVGEFCVFGGGPP